MSQLVPRTVPADPDPLAVFVEGARRAAQRARERWSANGGRLADLIDEELEAYRAQLEAVTR